MLQKINHVISLLTKPSYYLFFLSIFFIHLPSVYVLPIKSTLFTSHFITRLVFVAVAVIYAQQFPKAFPKKPILFVILLWFASQSISIITASNISSFLSQYKDVVFAPIIFISTYVITEKRNIIPIIITLLISTLANVIFQVILYFNPFTVLQYIQNIIYQKYLDYFEYQFNRSRFFGDTFDEVLIPFVLFLGFKSKKGILQLLFLCLAGLIFFITFVSNWRTKTVILAFATFCSLFILRQYLKKYLLLFLGIVAICIVLANYLSLHTVGKNVLDRIYFDGEFEYSTVINRFQYWQEAIEIGNSSPIIGVGLGNYYDNLSFRTQNEAKSSASATGKSFIARDDPHNIIVSTYATTGTFGLISLILLLSYFLLTDILFLRTSIYLQLFIVSFWSLFLFSLFNPSYHYAYISLYWFLRGVIEKLKVVEVS